jgi:polysaccharide biosynthesis/export protein
MKHLIFAMVGLLMATLSATAQDYQIKPGDTLRVEVLEDSTMNRSVLVAPDGRISLPLAGTVTVAGSSIDQVQAALVGKLAPSFAKAPTVFVGIETLATPRAGTGTGAGAGMRVYVIGQAKAPGKFTVARGTTILQFLAEMGGFTDFAATGRIQLHRTDKSGKETVYNLNYAAVEKGSATGLAGTVANGDVFVIPARNLFE